MLLMALGSVPAQQPPAPASKTKPPPVAALAYHPNGKYLAAAGLGEVYVIDVATGDVALKLTGQTAKVTALAFSRNGSRLAVASGNPGKSGEVRLYAISSAGLANSKPERTLDAHADIIYDLTFSPDGKTLATTGYDRLIKLWDTTTGKEANVLKDHSDTVYGLSFSPDGTYLASVSADRAVKIWEAASGKRLYTLSDSTDWVYAVAWSPDGKHVAAAGVDKSVRVWQVTADGVKLVHSVFAHEKPAVRLAYTADGQTLYSVGEDGVLKAWDTAKMVERKVYDKQPEAVLSLAVRPDQKQIALGRYDGTLVLLEEGTGKVQLEPLPFKPKPAQVSKVTPSSGQRGQRVRVTFEGKNLETVTEIAASQPGTTVAIVPNGRQPERLEAEVTFPATTPAAAYPLTLKSPAGPSVPVNFTVDLFPQVAETEPNDSPGTGQKITLPASVIGTITKAGDVDYFRFEANAGQEIGVQAVTAATGSKLDPYLVLVDGDGKIAAESGNGLLGHTCAKAGTYAIGIRDKEYRGGADKAYRLHVGAIPIVSSVFPLGVQRGTEASVQLDGVYLGANRIIKVSVPADAAVGSRVPVAFTTPEGAPLGTLTVVVGEFPEVGRDQKNPSGAPAIAVPGTGNGRIEKAGATETWRFSTKKGQRLILEVNARRIGSPLDSFIEILDDKGQPLPRAMLRCVSKTYTVFRDHDSSGPGIRMESWNDLAINDYLLVGSELMRIRELPKNPDDDCQFFSVAGQRVGYLDTTPTHHSLGTPMYKVAIHPPGTTFPPNGLPVVTLFYRNDDGGPGYGKDSRITFDPPADGEYQVRVGDSRGKGGSDYAYRLTIRPPRPDYSVSLSPNNPTVWKGGAIPVTVTADRRDGFEGAIQIKLENLPAGFTAPATTIPEGELSTAFALHAEASAVVPAQGAGIKLIAKATIDGREVVREASGGLPKLADAKDLATITDENEVTIEPGKEVRVTVHIERRNGFAGRVPLDVRGLPHGVRVLDIGLNGILITEKETSRTVVIYAEPWVKPMEHPFVVLSKRESTGNEFAAKSVLLKVKK
jgi:dipeptidyl aminopeptidase/acylaminoacyl peptidase